jgi:penicillin-binding protein 1A
VSDDIPTQSRSSTVPHDEAPVEDEISQLRSRPARRHPDNAAPAPATPAAPPPAGPPRRPPSIRWRPRRARPDWPEQNGQRPRTPRLRKLRFLLILLGLTALALISTIFGMMMAVASDLPQLENRAQYQAAANSFLYDDHWRPIGLFAPPDHVVIDTFDQISPYMRNAVISVEDRRFWSDQGVDLRGIGRAFLADVTGGSTQGASTIAQQFVKNALSEQNNRTVFEKLREAALAYHLTRRWPKEKILTEYLNSIYFGHGAYGVESAARVYFGKAHGYDSQSLSGQGSSGCGDAPRPACASLLAPWEAALLAGMVANPSGFDPIAHPHAALLRRNLVLKDMLLQNMITNDQYASATAKPVPVDADLQQPAEPPAAPYFTSWLGPQILHAMGQGHGVPPSVAEYRAYYGGLRIRTTLDLKMQQAADETISQDLPFGKGQPAVSLVAIDNKTGAVRAMVGGPVVNGQEDYKDFPFNLATEGHRQPGSSFKPFTLAVGLESGFGPGSVFTSAPADFIVPNSGGKEHFIVHNFGNQYSGSIDLQGATDYSDNSVYARLGIQGLGPSGTKRIAAMAKRLGIRSPVSTNYAMILGGLKIGVTTLDMAHAYESFATGGNRVFDPVLGSTNEGPTGIAQIDCPSACPQKTIVDKPVYQRVLPPSIAAQVHDMLTGPVQSGTATAAGISGVDVAGKTGTTSNYADAWFVGWTPQITTAVWVGYPNRLVPMSTLYNGGPVEGGTFPAVIWHDFMTQVLQILADEQAGSNPSNSTGTDTTGASSGSSGGSGGASSSGSSPAAGQGNSAGAPNTGGQGAAGGGAQGGGGTGGGGATGGGGGGGGATGGGGAGTGGGGSGSAGGGGGTGGGGSGSAGGGGTGGGGGGGGSSSGGASSGGAGVQ